jgi:hypothetical protein
MSPGIRVSRERGVGRRGELSSYNL